MEEQKNTGAGIRELWFWETEKLCVKVCLCPFNNPMSQKLKNKKMLLYCIFVSLYNIIIKLTLPIFSGLPHFAPLHQGVGFSRFFMKGNKKDVGVPDAPEAYLKSNLMNVILENKQVFFIILSRQPI